MTVRQGGALMARTTTTMALALVLAGCAMAGGSSPADAQLKAIKTQTNISPAERKQGTVAHPQLLQEFGGAYKGPQAAYVNRVGQKFAHQSGLSRSPDRKSTRLNSSH